MSAHCARKAGHAFRFYAVWDEHASRASARELVNQSTVPYDSTVCGSAAGGHVQAVDRWTDGRRGARTPAGGGRPLHDCFNTVSTPVFWSQHLVSQHLFWRLNSCHLRQIRVLMLKLSPCRRAIEVSRFGCFFPARKRAPQRRCLYTWPARHAANPGRDRRVQTV